MHCLFQTIVILLFFCQENNSIVHNDMKQLYWQINGDVRPIVRLSASTTWFAVSGKVGPVQPVNHTSWMTVDTPTDRPKSVRNCGVIEIFVALFVLSLCPFDISAGVEAFVIGLSQIPSFFS